MTTRATILSRALGRLAMGDYQFDVTPDERAATRTSLDAMMAEWDAVGITLGYTTSDGDNDADDMTTPPWADQAIWSNLALRMAPDFGKMPSPDLKRDARRGMDLVTSKTLVIPAQVRARGSVHGGGERFYRRHGW